MDAHYIKPIDPMERYLPIDQVVLPTSVTRFAAKGHCDWCEKELTGRSKRFCAGQETDYYGYVRRDCMWAFYRYWYSVHAFKRAVFIRDDFTCQKCGRKPMRADKPWLPDLSELHCDHIIPISKDGDTVMENLQTLCAKCNLKKGNRTEEAGKAGRGQRHEEDLPGRKRARGVPLDEETLEWLDRHLSNFPGGELPEQKLEVMVDGRHLFTATDRIKPEAKKVMQNGVRT